MGESLRVVTPAGTDPPAQGTPTGAATSIRSIRSIASAGSILSIGSAGSILSIGSAGSILSIGSAGSVGTVVRAVRGPGSTPLVVALAATAVGLVRPLVRGRGP